MNILIVVLILIFVIAALRIRHTESVVRSDREYDARLAADTLDTYRRMYQTGELK